MNKDIFRKDKKFFIISIFVLIIVLIVSYVFINDIPLIVPAVAEGAISVDIEENNATGLQINEVMSSNGGVIADSEGNVYDWVELYNGTDKDINLKDYRLSDVKYSKWAFGDEIIKAKSYLVVFLSGNSKDTSEANFKIRSKGGEMLNLRDPSGAVIDRVQMPALEKNEALARDTENNWVRYKISTPGYENSLKGYQAYQSSLLNLGNDLIITEILPKNEGNFKNASGEYSDCIEITNTSDADINLKNYSLSDDASTPFKWQFDNVTISPGEHIVVYATNEKKIINNEIHVSFRLSSEDGCVILTNNKGRIIDKVEYGNLPDGYAVIKEGDDYIYSSTINPGYDNTLAGTAAFSERYYLNPDSLMINEVMNNNSSYLVQSGGEYYDWIELKNNSGEELNLSEYSITTDITNKAMYTLPDKILKPGEYFVLIASGDTALSDNSYYHTNFKVTAKESLYLCEGDDIKDSMFIADVPVGYSKGRTATNGFLYISKPTPVADNNKGNYEITCKPYFTVASGIYNDVSYIKVEIKGAGDIYYTLDGSVPTTSSKKYTGPIKLKRTTVIKAIAKQEGKPQSAKNVSSYIINENHTLPVMSVSMNSSSFNSVQGNAWTEGYEVAAYAEFFELTGEGFDVPCGFKLFGGSTRGHSKKSFTLNFRKKYGEGRLNYKVFENRDFTSFNSLVLRTGSQDSEFAVIRDVVATSLINQYTDVDVQAYRPVILYINGKYWGIYYIREFVDENFVASHYNVSSDDTDLLRIDGQVKSGSRSSYNELIAYIKKHNMSVQKNYEYVKEKIDINNLIDFWVAEVYTTNNDIVNCRFFSNLQVDGGKWKFIAYDFDYAMYNQEVNYFYFATNSGGMTQNHYSTELLRNLMKNKEFKQTFLERLSYNMKNTWKKETVLAQIDKAYNEIKAEMPRNQARWGMTMAQWKSGIARLKLFVNLREGYLLKQTKSYFHLTDSEMEKYFGD